MTDNGELAMHPAALAFPEMDAESFAALKDDIKRHGQRDPVVLWRGQLLDGRHRYRACTELGRIVDEFSLSDDTDPVAFVVSANLHRRHLTPSQRAALAVDLLPSIEKEAKERQKRKPKDSVKERIPEQKRQARDEAAALCGVNPRYVSDAKKIKEESPETFKKVESGEMTLRQAKRAVAPPPPKAHELSDRFVRIVDDFVVAVEEIYQVFGGPAKLVRHEDWDASQTNYVRQHLNGLSSLITKLKGDFPNDKPKRSTK